MKTFKLTLFIVFITGLIFRLQAQEAEKSPNEKAAANALDSTLAKNFRLDFAVPDHPAFNVLENNPDEILRPSGSEVFSIIYSNFIMGRVPIIPKDFAMEFSPAQVIRANKLTYGDFNVTPRKDANGHSKSVVFNGKQIYNGIRISLGTKASKNADSLQNLAVGISIPLIDRGDYRTDPVYKDKIIEKLTNFLDKSNSFDELSAKVIYHYLLVDKKYDAQIGEFASAISKIKADYQNERDKSKPIENAIADINLAVQKLEEANQNIDDILKGQVDDIKIVELVKAKKANSEKIGGHKKQLEELNKQLREANVRLALKNYTYESLIVGENNFDKAYPSLAGNRDNVIATISAATIKDFESLINKYSDAKELMGVDSAHLYFAKLAQNYIETKVASDVEEYKKPYINITNKYYEKLTEHKIEDEIKSLKQEYKEKNWNSLKWIVAGAFRFSSADSLVKNLYYSKTALWTTLAVPLGNRAKKASNQLLVGFQYSNERFDTISIVKRDSTISDTSTTEITDTLPDKYFTSRFSFGLRIYGGVNRIKAFLEANVAGVPKSLVKIGLNGGLEWNIYDGIWLLANGGADFTWHKISDVKADGTRADAKWQSKATVTPSWKIDFRFNIPEKSKLF